MAYGAIKAGMINITSDVQRMKVTRVVQDHQEKILKLKNSDFERICLPSETVENLWQISSSALKVEPIVDVALKSEIVMV